MGATYSTDESYGRNTIQSGILVRSSYSNGDRHFLLQSQIIRSNNKYRWMKSEPKPSEWKMLGMRRETWGVSLATIYYSIVESMHRGRDDTMIRQIQKLRIEKKDQNNVGITI